MTNTAAVFLLAVYLLIGPAVAFVALIYVASALVLRIFKLSRNPVARRASFSRDGRPASVSPHGRRPQSEVYED
jgi:hypothetical protein